MIFSGLQTETVSVAMEKYPARDDSEKEILDELAPYFHYYAGRHIIRLAPAMEWAKAVGITLPPAPDTDGCDPQYDAAYDRAIRIGRAMQIAAFRKVHDTFPKLRIISEKYRFGKLIESMHPAVEEVNQAIQNAIEAGLEAGRRGEESSENRPHWLPMPEEMELYDGRPDDLEFIIKVLLWAIGERGYYSREGGGGAWPRAAADIPAVLNSRQRQVAADLIYRLGREVGEVQVYLPSADHLARHHGITMEAAEEALAAAEQVLRWHHATYKRATAEQYSRLDVPQDILAVEAWQLLSDQQIRGFFAAEQTLWQHIHGAMNPV